nr:MAG: hypothetical protein [Metapenaeus ensis nimavirus]
MAHSLYLLSGSIGYLKARGFPTCYLSSTSFMNEVLDLLSTCNVDNIMEDDKAMKPDMAVESSLSRVPSLVEESLSPSLEDDIIGAANDEVMKEIATKTREYINGGRHQIFDQVLAIGLYFFSPIFEQIMYTKDIS